MKVVVILSLNDGSCVSGDDDDDDDARSLKSGLVLPTQIFGLFGPPKKRVNFDKFNQRQKCVFCVLTALYISKTFPKAQQTQGLSSSCQSKFLRSY